jgi:hypothetical protein
MSPPTSTSPAVGAACESGTSHDPAGVAALHRGRHRRIRDRPGGSPMGLGLRGRARAATAPGALLTPACARPRSGVRRSARAEAGTLAKIITPYRREYPDFPVEERSLTKSSADRPGEEAESRNHGQLVTLWPTHSEIWPLLLRTYTDIWGEECVRELLKTLMCVEPAPGDRIIPTWLLPVPTRS